VRTDLLDGPCVDARYAVVLRLVTPVDPRFVSLDQGSPYPAVGKLHVLLSREALTRNQRSISASVPAPAAKSAKRSRLTEETNMGLDEAGDRRTDHIADHAIPP
jgi:hypothetical protein